MYFEINQIVNLMLLGKTFSKIILMLIYPRHQIAGHPNIQCTVPPTGQNIYIALFQFYPEMMSTLVHYCYAGTRDGFCEYN